MNNSTTGQMQANNCRRLRFFLSFFLSIQTLYQKLQSEVETGSTFRLPVSVSHFGWMRSDTPNTQLNATHRVGPDVNPFHKYTVSPIISGIDMRGLDEWTQRLAFFLSDPDYFLHAWTHHERTILWTLAAGVNELIQDITPDWFSRSCLGFMC